MCACGFELLLGCALRLSGGSELRAERLELLLLCGCEVVAEQRFDLLRRESLDGLVAQAAAFGLALLECGARFGERLAQCLGLFGRGVGGGSGRGLELVGELECLAACGGAGCGLAELLELGLAGLHGVSGCGLGDASLGRLLHQ